MNKIINIKGYKLFKLLGKGTFGKVYLSVKENNPELLATKVIDKSKMKGNKKLKYLKNEEKILEELKHSNIIRFDNFIESKNHYFFIMEYCNGGSLLYLLKKYKEKYRKPFPLEIIQYYMKQIIEGLKYMHSKNIIHRDLKLDNILVQFKNTSRKSKAGIIDFNELNDNDFLNSNIKIIDFGLSTKLDPGKLTKTIVGSPSFMDPFILTNYQNAKGDQLLEGYNEKADIWSLGAICFQMLTGDPLFAVYDLKGLFQKVKEGNYAIPIDIEISDEIISFLNSMLRYDRDLRPSCEELLKHKFLINNVKDFRKIDYLKNPESQDISYIIINAMRNSIYVNNNKKLKNSKEIYLNYLDLLLKDYKAAKNYFKDNGFFDREKDADQKCLIIENIKNQLNPRIKIYLNNLPKKISPEYIYGCSTIERNKKFKEILSKYRAEKNLLEVKLKNFENNKFGKNEKDEYEKNIINYNKLKAIIEHLENTFKNIWAPPPYYTKEIQKQPKEIISFDKCKFNVKIKIERVDKINDNLDLIITLVINQEKKLNKKIELKAGHNSKEFIWTLSADEWMNIDNNTTNFFLVIEIDKFQLFTKNTVPKIIEDISKIKSGTEINFTRQITDNGVKIINILIFPILPEGEKSVIMEEKEIISVKQIYLPFQLEPINNIFMEKPSQKVFIFNESKKSINKKNII